MTQTKKKSINTQDKKNSKQIINEKITFIKEKKKINLSKFK